MESIVRQVQRVQRGHVCKTCWQPPDCRHGAVRLLARHLPAQRPTGSAEQGFWSAGGDSRHLGLCAVRKARICEHSGVQGILQARLIVEQELLSRAGSEQWPGAHSSTTRSSELQVTKLHSTGRHGEPQSHPRAPRPATKSFQFMTLFFRSSSGPAARMVQES